MHSLFIIVIIFAVIIFIIISAARLCLKKQSKYLCEKINRIPFYKNENNNNNDNLTVPAEHKNFSSDLITNFEISFADCYITFSKEEAFCNYYRDYYNEAATLLSKLKTFRIKPSEDIVKLVEDFRNIESRVKSHNHQVAQKTLCTHKLFFDNCLKYPLDNQQRRSIISEEENCLVVSSAGSGKTSSIVGKVKYLIDIKGIDPSRILLISYTNKAAAELTERVGVKNLRGYTFHKLALDLIGQCVGEKPSICNNADALFVKIYRDLLTKRKFRKAVVDYYVDYQAYELDWEKRKNERRQQLSEQKEIRLRHYFRIWTVMIFM